MALGRKLHRMHKKLPRVTCCGGIYDDFLQACVRGVLPPALNSTSCLVKYVTNSSILLNLYIGNEIYEILIQSRDGNNLISNLKFGVDQWDLITA
jgi:hypothetical protein